MSLLRALLSRGEEAPEGGRRAKKKKKTAAPVEALAPSATAWPKVVGPADAVLYGTVIALIAFGVVMVYSASAVFASQRYDDGTFFLVRQGVFALVALPMMVALARIDYHRYRPLTYPILGVVMVLMLVVAFGFGHRAGGADRWIAIGPIHIQPAEMAKIAMIFYLAYSLSKKREKVKSFSVGFLPHVVVAAVFMVLCLKQPDLGSAVMIGLLTFVLLFTAGAKLGYILGACMAALPVIYFAIKTSPWRMSRIEGWLAPFEHRQDSGYQVAESLISFGSGGLSGVGLGDSRQKLWFLPEAHTDFISAIVTEELGLVGLSLLMIAFLIVFARGMRAAWRATDEYGMYLAVGITLFFGIQAFANLAVAMGMLPTKGLVLPFISYGGSSLLVNSAAIGVLLNISRPRAPTPGSAADKEPRGGRARALALQGGIA